MISYCPLELEPEPPPPPPPRRQNQPTTPVPVGTAAPVVVEEDTECNYLVLFFILGVMILAASDSISIRHR